MNMKHLRENNSMVDQYKNWLDGEKGNTINLEYVNSALSYIGTWEGMAFQTDDEIGLDFHDLESDKTITNVKRLIDSLEAWHPFTDGDEVSLGLDLLKASLPKDHPQYVELEMNENNSLADQYKEWSNKKKGVENPQELSREDSIAFIKNIVNQNNATIGMYDLEADQSPIYTSAPGTCDYIEYLNTNEVVIERWNLNDGSQDAFHEYGVPYEELSDDLLKTLQGLIDNALDSGLIEGL